MTISPDEIVYFRVGWFAFNATIAFTWAIMAALAFGSWMITRSLTDETAISDGQNLLEVIVGGLREQIHEVTQQDPDRYLPFIGTLFLFILTSNVLSIVPGIHPPTGSLSTTAALALCVFFAVPIFGIREQGWKTYLRSYIQPTPVMLPFNIVGELSRTLALAVRLFGNVMSGTMISAILLAIAPLFFPVLMHALGLLTGVIQAYIFAILAMVYIASASQAHDDDEPKSDRPAGGKLESKGANLNG